MSRIQKSFPWIQIALFLVIFLMVLGVAALYREELKESLLVPLLYILWIGELTFKSFDQQCIWLLALTIALVLSVSFSRQSRKPVEKSRLKRRRSSLAAGRIRFWRGQLRVGSSSVYAHSYRRLAIRQLVLRALAYRMGLDEEEIKAQIHSGRLQVPSEVGYVLGMDTTQDQPVGFLKRLQGRFEAITEWFGTSTFSPDPRLEKVADYLENLLEVENDVRNR
jgi:hypothetical protein